jgi:uncharacterized protein (TIGR02328 family)
MRLWHTDLVTRLPSKIDYPGCSNQLGGQHSEVRMMLSVIKKKGKVNHSTVNYINKYSVSHLKAYGLFVAWVMQKRGFNVSKDIIAEYTCDPEAVEILRKYLADGVPIYAEHNHYYMVECVDNLRKKGVTPYEAS